MEAKLKPKPFTERQLVALREQKGLSQRERRVIETALEAIRSRQPIEPATVITLEAETPRVLVVVESNGNVSVYGEAECEVIHVPKCEPENDAKVAKIVRHLIPPDFRELWDAAKPIGFGNVRLCPSAIELLWWEQNRPAANPLNLANET